MGWESGGENGAIKSIETQTHDRQIPQRHKGNNDRHEARVRRPSTHSKQTLCPTHILHAYKAFRDGVDTIPHGRGPSKRGRTGIPTVCTSMSFFAADVTRIHGMRFDDKKKKHIFSLLCLAQLLRYCITHGPPGPEIAAVMVRQQPRCELSSLRQATDGASVCMRIRVCANRGRGCRGSICIHRENCTKARA